MNFQNAPISSAELSNSNIKQYNGAGPPSSILSNQYSLYVVPPNRKRKRKPRLFSKDIENLLFALGDRPALTDGTIAALEDVLIEYLVDLCHKFQSYAHTQGRTRVKMNDVVFALRNDPLKLARLEYIVEQNDRIQRAKKMFEAKTGSFAEIGGDKKGREDQDSDDDLDDGDDEEDSGRTTETKKKKKSSER